MSAGGTPRHDPTAEVFGKVLQMLPRHADPAKSLGFSIFIHLGAIGFDAVKHLILCRIERRPPRLDLSIYPYVPRATVETTSAKAYMGLLPSGKGEAA